MTDQQEGHWEYRFGEPGSTTIRLEIHVPTDRMMITFIQTGPDGVTETGAAFGRETMRKVYRGIGRYLAHDPYNRQDSQQ